MRFAVMGAGAIGGYFGGRLHQAGEEVHFIARGAHLEAMQRNGLQIYSAHGDVHLDGIRATDDPSSIGPVDVVLFCLKLWDTESGARLIEPLLGPDTAVYSFQNGIYAEGKLSELLGREHVIGGYAATPVSIVSPGVVRQVGPRCTLGFGELDNRRTKRVEALLAACQRAGIDAHIEPDIEAALWKKFVFIAANSGGTAFCRAPLGPIRSDPWGRRFLTGLLSETAQVARALKIGIPDDLEQSLMAEVDRAPWEAQGSMYTDLQNHARLELDWLNGLVVQLGEENGIPTPCNRAVMSALHLHKMGVSKPPVADRDRIVS
jgi:2-dehydropantoate 2-reductase